ncbi:MAG: hypothetical protein SPL71_08965 [Oribacterium sp.]|nr:hypothetical protein [Oribacterium sp.]
MKKTYDDYYAQVRKVSGDRKIVYSWINNLLKEDFVKLENGNYCLAGDGEYNGLRVSYFIEFKQNIYCNPRSVHTNLPIEFRGHDSVKGICLHAKKNSIPCKYINRSGEIRMKVSWEGSCKSLSFKNEKERNIEKYQRKMKS